MQCASSKRGESKVEWAPFNEPGFQLFPNAFPNLGDVKGVPVQALDCAALRCTIAAYRLLMPSSSAQWWETFLQMNEAKVAAQCAECTRSRSELLSNAQRKGDEPEVARGKLVYVQQRIDG